MLDEFNHFFKSDEKDLKILLESFIDKEPISTSAAVNMITKIIDISKKNGYHWCNMFGISETNLKYYNEYDTVFTPYLKCLTNNIIMEYNAYKTNEIFKYKYMERCIDSGEITIQQYINDVSKQSNGILDLIDIHYDDNIIQEAAEDSMTRVEKPPKYLYYGNYEDIAEDLGDKFYDEIPMPKKGLRCSPHRAVAAIFGLDHDIIYNDTKDSVFEIKYRNIEPLLNNDKNNHLDDIPRKVIIDVYCSRKPGITKRRFRLIDPHLYTIPTDEDNLKNNIYMDDMSPLKTFFIPAKCGNIKCIHEPYGTGYGMRVEIFYYKKDYAKYEKKVK